MIESGLEYQIDALGNLLIAFESLPTGLKPLYFASDERVVGGRNNLFEDKSRLMTFVEKSKAGFFLRGPGLTYSIRVAGSKPIVCDCFLDVEDSMVREFLSRMAAAKPLFAFACKPEEREWRNRITVKLGENRIESWVGRDTNKYIPGLYWLTIIPERLANMHDIDIGKLSKISVGHSHADGQMHLFQFYQYSEDWINNKDRLDALCTSTPGIFSMSTVRSTALAATTYGELQSILELHR